MIRMQSFKGIIDYRSNDTTIFFSAFQRFRYHVSVEHDEKHPEPKFGGSQGLRYGRMNT